MRNDTFLPEFTSRRNTKPIESIEITQFDRHVRVLVCDIDFVSKSVLRSVSILGIGESQKDRPQISWFEICWFMSSLLVVPPICFMDIYPCCERRATKCQCPLGQGLEGPPFLTGATRPTQKMEDESNQIVSGWWLTYPSEKYESQLGLQFPTEWKN